MHPDRRRAGRAIRKKRRLNRGIAREVEQAVNALAAFTASAKMASVALAALHLRYSREGDTQ